MSNVDFTPATRNQKISIVAGLSLISAVALLLGAWTVDRLEAAMRARVTVAWALPPGVTLQPADSVSFWYDRKNKLLVHRGPIDKEVKAELLELLDSDGGAGDDSNETASAIVASYHSAIDELAFVASEQLGATLNLLLLLGGIGGVIGILLRSVSNFIGVACFKNRLDANRWWPWYVLRPVLGFLVGVLVVILMKADLYQPEGASGEGSLWWLGLSILAGFGAEDFGLRLRMLSHTLFGVSEAEKPKKDEAGQTTPKPTTVPAGQTGQGQSSPAPSATGDAAGLPAPAGAT